MQRSEKEQIVDELTEQLRSTETLIVADYRGLSVKEIDDLRTKLIEHGARLTVVKNSLTRRAAEAAGADAVLALLDGPTAIAFLEAEGDPVAVAKALSESARTTRVLAVRGGVMQGRTITGDDVEELAKLPATEILRGQVLGALTAPLYAIVGLFAAPLQDLYGLIEARIEQLGGAEAEAPAAEEATAEAEAVEEEPVAAGEPEVTDSGESNESEAPEAAEESGEEEA